MAPKGKSTAPANTSVKRKSTAAKRSAPPGKRTRAAAKSAASEKSTTTAVVVKPAPPVKRAAVTAAADAKKTAATRKKPATAAKKAVPSKKASSASKAVAATKAAAPQTVASKTSPSRRKRKADFDDEASEEQKKKPVKKARTAAPPKPAKAAVAINEAPKSVLEVFVFGEGSNGELGLGAKGNVTDVKRPRLNPFLKDAKVVAVAVGGMHYACLTADGKVLTCGVNDQGALGRDTTYEGGMKDIDDDESNAGSDTGLNPFESTPAEVLLEHVPEGTVFTQLAAGDSTTMAVTSEGHVYGCGTFRNNEGILGFNRSVRVQRTLAKVEGLKNIVSVACGANHALALDNKGNVFAWGAGQQNQLGRRVIERTRFNGLEPRQFGLPKGKVTFVTAGSYHSFAIDKAGNVWSWGLNSYGETGIADGAGEDEAVILKPSIVEQLSGKQVVRLAGGGHHSLAVTAAGECLSWGRMDGAQTGLDVSALGDEDVIRDEKGNARILMAAKPIPNLGHAVHPACGTDHGFVVNAAGRAFSFGFSVNYQTGQGTTDDVQVATLVDNTATRGKKLVFAGCGGQFGVLAGLAEDQRQ